MLLLGILGVLMLGLWCAGAEPSVRVTDPAEDDRFTDPNQTIKGRASTDEHRLVLNRDDFEDGHFESMTMAGGDLEKHRRVEHV